MISAVLAITSTLLGGPNPVAWQDPAAPPAPAPTQAAPSQAAQDDAKHKQDIQNDIEAGKKYAEQADKELKVSQDAEANARLQRIGADIAAIANANPITALWGDKRFSAFPYSFKLVEGKDVNAFSLPGGYIYVYEGLIKYCESDDELAGVLAHEVAHASLRHVATLQREQSKLNAIQLPLILIAILASSNQAGNVIQGVGVLGTAIGSGWSVKAEEAADYGGFQYMLKSKYNPTGMLTLMERLARDEKNQPTIDWGIYQTHPPSRERADSLSHDMAEANVPIERSKVTTSFRATVKPGEDHSVDILFGKKKLVSFGGSDALQRADDTVVRLNSFFDDVPDLFEIGTGEDGAILGRRRPLIKLTADDAAVAKMTVEDLKKETVRNLRVALYGLAYRVWDLR